MPQQITMAPNQTNKTPTNDQQSLHTHQTSQTISCWTRIVSANWTTRFRLRINMRKTWIMEVSRTCRRPQVWRFRMAASTMVHLKISNSMLLSLSMSFSWTVWIIREPATVNSSTSWALAQQSIIQAYFGDILDTEICSIKIWKREKLGLEWKLRRWVTRARQCQAWMKYWHSYIRIQVSGRDTRITAGQCSTVGSTLEASRTPSLTTSMATLGSSTQSRSNQRVGRLKLTRHSKLLASILQTVTGKMVSRYWSNSPHLMLKRNSSLTPTSPNILTRWTMVPTEEEGSTSHHPWPQAQRSLRRPISSSAWTEFCKHRERMNQDHHRKEVKMLVLRAVILSQTRASSIHSINTIEESLQQITKAIPRCSTIRELNTQTNKPSHRLHICLKASTAQATPSPTPFRKDSQRDGHRSQISDPHCISALRDIPLAPQVKSNWLNQETTSIWNIILTSTIESRHIQSKIRKYEFHLLSRRRKYRACRRRRRQDWYKVVHNQQRMLRRYQKTWLVLRMQWRSSKTKLSKTYRRTKVIKQQWSKIIWDQ